MCKYFTKLWQKWLNPKPPIDTPTEAELKSWATSEWIEYQAWLFHYSYLSLYDWQQLRKKALNWQQRPLLSIITPVYNTHPDYLRECIYSVQTQAYPDWEMCLVDDGSDKPATINYLEQIVATDSRLHLHRFSNNQGICHATNRALAMAHGEYIVFLDHDDRLAPDALYHVIKTLRNHPNTDIIYSDRDMLSPNGFRFMHLFKPDWSPETLLSGNYLFHMVVYKRQLIEQLGGVRVGKEGSQDYDLILRATETQAQVQHIQKILYHWRQHEQSVAMEHNAKEYAYIAGIQALQETLKRRGLQANVTENKELWRGHYRIHLTPPPPETYKILQLNTLNDYALQINQAFERENETEYLVILGPSVQALHKKTITELISWLQINEVGMVTGKILNKKEQILHAGLVQRPNGIPLSLYAGHPENTPGYMAVTAIVRNISSPHPACCVLRRSLWLNKAGLDTNYLGPHALLDFALRALTTGTRFVYTPFARFTANQWQTPQEWPQKDRQRFIEQWTEWLKKTDPYYNPYLSLELADMGLEVQPPPTKLNHLNHINEN